MWAAALLILALDQVSKALVVRTMVPGESMTVIPHVLRWTYVQNTHGAFNLFGNYPPLFVVMSAGVMLFFWSVFREQARQSGGVRLAFGTLLGGAIANVADRLHYHFVVDFVDFHGIWGWVFNLADAAITLSVLTLIALTWRMRRHSVAPS